MARRKAPRIPDALLDQLLAGADPKSAFDANGLLDELKKAFAERALNAEMDHHLAGEEGNIRNGYGRKGEYVCFDVHPFRTTKVEHWLAHLVNSRRTFLRLVQKARTFDEKAARQLVADRNHAALDQMVLEHLMGK